METPMTKQDYFWALMYVAKEKKYRLAETHVGANGEIVVNRTFWDMLSAALSYIEQNEQGATAGQGELTWTTPD